jgi:multidrug transporter EmrE-like cation transporter
LRCWAHERREEQQEPDVSTPPISVFLFVLAALFGAVGQYLYKSGAEAADGTLMSFVLNLRILGGVVCYIAVMVLFVAAFRKGGALSVLYPVYASTFIFAAIIALLAFGEPIKWVNVVGMGVLVLGMFLMGR